MPLPDRVSTTETLTLRDVVSAGNVRSVKRAGPASSSTVCEAAVIVTVGKSGLTDTLADVGATTS